MRTFAGWLLFAVVLLGAPIAFTQEEASVFPVETALFDWKDSARDRKVPAKIYYPADKATPSPVIIFSHGLGGSRNGYEYLGRYWASRGFVSVHIQHVGSDDQVWKDSPTPRIALRAAAMDLRNAANRPRDVSFAIDQLAALAAKDPAWAARLDLRRIGCAGHSFGANTAMLIGGQTLGVQPDVFRDPRVKAVIALSEPVLAKMPTSVFATVEVPVLHMTGTKDDSPVGETAAAARRIPFDQINGPKQYLLILQNGDHMVFAKPPSEAEQKLLDEVTTAFWQAYLEDSTEARHWLDTELRQQLGDRGTLESKGN